MFVARKRISTEPDSDCFGRLLRGLVPEALATMGNGQVSRTIHEQLALGKSPLTLLYRYDAFQAAYVKVGLVLPRV